MRKPAFILVTFFVSMLATVAQPATGEGAAHFAKQLLPLWDLTGTYDTSQGGFISAYALSHAANGRLTLAGFSRRDDDEVNTHIQGTSSGSGRVTGTLAGGTKGTGRAIANVSGVVNGTFLNATATGQTKWAVDAVGNHLVEATTLRTCVSGAGCEGSMVGRAFPLAPNGDWGISTTLSANGNRLSGSAVLVLTNGRAFNFTASGVYSPKKDFSTIKLLGTGESTGANLTVTIRGSDKAFVRVRGVVLGQRLKYAM